MCVCFLTLHSIVDSQSEYNSEDTRFKEVPLIVHRSAEQLLEAGVCACMHVCVLVCMRVCVYACACMQTDALW